MSLSYLFVTFKSIKTGKKRAWAFYFLLVPTQHMFVMLGPYLGPSLAAPSQICPVRYYHQEALSGSSIKRLVYQKWERVCGVKLADGWGWFQGNEVMYTFEGS